MLRRFWNDLLPEERRLTNKYYNKTRAVVALGSFITLPPPINDDSNLNTRTFCVQIGNETEPTHRVDRYSGESVIWKSVAVASCIRVMSRHCLRTFFYFFFVLLFVTQIRLTSLQEKKQQTRPTLRVLCMLWPSKREVQAQTCAVLFYFYITIAAHINDIIHELTCICYR